MSCRLEPWVAGRSNRVLPGITALLFSAVSTTRSPSEPARVLFCELSSPTRPTSLRSSASQVAVPMTLAARSPAGYWRSSRRSSAISGNRSRSARATSGSTSLSSTT